jgi:hypothetical protein
MRDSAGMDGRPRPSIHRARHKPVTAGAVILLAFLCVGADGGGCGGDSAITPAADAGVQKPDSGKVGTPCLDRRDCDDGVFCNGVEECVSGFCISPRNAACRDPGGCAQATCDEAAGGCLIDPTVGSCAAGICLADLGCSSTTCASPSECDDGRSCTDDLCEGGHCLHVPIDARCPSSVGACGQGLCLGDKIADATGCGANPDASRCKETEGCDASFTCVPLKATCTIDADCTDGSLCDGLERCLAGKCARGDRTRCVARDACHRSVCRQRALGDSYCVETKLSKCP